MCIFEKKVKVKYKMESASLVHHLNTYLVKLAPLKDEAMALMGTLILFLHSVLTDKHLMLSLISAIFIDWVATGLLSTLTPFSHSFIDALSTGAGALFGIRVWSHLELELDDPEYEAPEEGEKVVEKDESVKKE